MQVPPDVPMHHADAVDKAVAGLRYGSVNINVATMLGFSVPKLTWGAYPGNTPQARPSPMLAVLLLVHVYLFPLSQQKMHLLCWAVTSWILASVLSGKKLETNVGLNNAESGCACSGVEGRVNARVGGLWCALGLS